MLESDVSVGDGGVKREQEEVTTTTVLSMSLACEDGNTYMDILVIQLDDRCTGMI
jgi:hypothetical protein